MGWRNEDERDTGRPFWREAVAWLGCLAVAVMPTVMLAMVAQTIDAWVWPGFIPALYVGVFTLAVLVVRPWTIR